MIGTSFRKQSVLSMGFLLALAQGFLQYTWAANELCVAEEWKNVPFYTTQIVSILDGDTIKVKGRKGGVFNVRLLSIDTPELHYQGMSQGVWAELAGNRLAEMAPIGTEVKIEFEGAVCDRYQRMLGHAFIGALHLNRQMVREGFAVNYCIYPNIKYCADFASLAKVHIEAKTGIFGDANLELPYEWRRLMSGAAHSKYIGSLASKQVLPPGNLDHFQIWDRIFFLTASDVKAPFHMVGATDSE